MNYLFVDTAEGTRVLLGVGDKTYYAENYSNAGAETLMPTVHSILSQAGMSVNDIDILGACVGPGSFTGLRIGLTTIKALCYALDKPCFAVNNLRLYSYNNEERKVISLAAAGSNVVYLARYDGDVELDAPKCVTVEAAAEYIKSHPDFAVSTDRKLGKVFGGQSGVGEKEMIAAVKKHISSRIEQKELLPLYIRKAQPERGDGDL
ncbi:MAG: tRNA (adenosine(37)-N6)-threonylcarbamoyltransferase complex dimerization subunit type 1 TsaB [Clostridiales bacterium]|nr:tRNA (adenosine(37)-N6)-threonylcarbamoyltransferase complex dimerization subunit type 1 TsaB [Clostridiales bacterium]